MEMQFNLLIEWLTCSEIQVPDFQRKYAWKDKLWKEFINDISKFSNSPHDGKYYSLGTIYLYKNKKTGIMQKYSVIDGQQRLITFILLLKAIHSIWKKQNKKECLNQSSNIDKKELDFKDISSYKISTFLKKIKKNFKANKSDLEFLEEILNDSKISKNCNSLIPKCYNFFETIIQDFDNKNKHNFNLSSIYNDGLLKIKVVFITFSESENDPHCIFENLNSKRKKLESIDLIRNYILMKCKGWQRNEQNDEWYKNWSRVEEKFQNNAEIQTFLFHYLKYKNKGPVAKENIYWEFKRICEQQNNKNRIIKKAKWDEEKEIKKKITSIIKEISEFALLYMQIIKKSAYPTKIERVLHRLRVAVKCGSKIAVHYCYLLSVLNDYKKNLININDLETILKLIESYFCRIRFSANSTPRNWSSFFAGLSKQIKEVLSETWDGKMYIESLKIILKNLTGEMEFVKDENLKRLIVKNNWSKNLKKALGFLKLLEMKKVNKDKLDDDNDIQLEHIMPQIPSTDWKRYTRKGEIADSIHNIYLNNIGNLTLIRKEKNQQISNMSFNKKKKKCYKVSHFSLTQSLCDYENWYQNEIENRANKLAELATITWPYLKVKSIKHPAKINHFNAKILDLTANENLFTNTNIKCLYIDNKKVEFQNKKIRWTNVLIQICKFLYEFNPGKFMEIKEKRNISIFYVNEKKRNKEILPNIFIKTQSETKEKIMALKKLTSKLGYSPKKIQFEVIKNLK